MHRRTSLLVVAGVALTTLSAVAFGGGGTAVAAAATPIYLDRTYSPTERAADLVSRLTLAEKAEQLDSSQAAAIPRLGIPAYGWWNEAAHGVAREGTVDNANPPTFVNTTSYPVDLSAGSTWNPDLVHQEASLVSDEARDIVRDNRLDLNFYSPTVNLARDPRWGRNDESWSEDPTLTAAMASQYVNGLQGQDENGQLPASADGYLKALATIKHFAANNSEFNRLNGSSNMDERTLREYYTKQFEGIVQQSNPTSIMSSYNEVNGVPSSVNVPLLDTLARQTFGFDGFVSSDCDAVYIVQNGHHWTPPNSTVPVDQNSRTAYAMTAGTDLDCQQGYHDGYSYGNTIPTAISQKIVTETGTFNENDVDVALVRVFTARIETGEFDAASEVPWVQQARQRLAPGTFVNTDANQAVTETPARLAMARKVADQSIVLLKNDATSNGSPLLPLKVPATGAYKVAVVGAYANPAQMFLGGYSSDQGPAGVAKEVNGYQGLKAAITAKNPGAEVDFLPGVTGADLGTVDPATIAAVKGYDAVVVCVGTDASTAGEDGDRANLNLPGAQASMISQVVKANPRTAVYMETIGQVDVRSFQKQVPALLWSSYNGQRKGEALADVVLGAVNPSGHLPFTWYANEAQIPPIGDYTIRPTATTDGRTYMYFDGDVSYPFGHGLSYSTFRYGNVRIGSSSIDPAGNVTVTADVTNTGSVKGSDVPQLYVTTPFTPAAKARPAKRLVGFEKVTLAKGATTKVTFTVAAKDLAFFDETRNSYLLDPGRYAFQVASSAADTDVAATVGAVSTGVLPEVPATVTAKPSAVGDGAGVTQRVHFTVGQKIDPKLTVALRDETVLGYVTRGASVPLPGDMKITYRSDRTSVVTTSGNVVRAVGRGVATVTATVSWHGGTASGTFVAQVG